jgi:hypothetical protein
MSSTSASLTRRGRPRGSRTIPPELVVRLPVHLTIHRIRHPRLSAWLAHRESGRLAGDVVDLMERALAGADVAMETGGGEVQSQVYEIDMSGLLEWD